MSMGKRVVAVALAAGLAFCFAGCPRRSTGDKVHDAVQDAGGAVRDAGHDVGNAVKDATR